MAIYGFLQMSIPPPPTSSLIVVLCHPGRPQQKTATTSSRFLHLHTVHSSPSAFNYSGDRCPVKFNFGLRRIPPQSVQRKSTVPASMFAESWIVGDICATALSGCIALSLLRFWEETAKRGLFDQKLNRKLVHTSIGLVFMLCWPMFSSGSRGALLASLVPGINIVKMLLLGLGLWKDEAAVKSISRFGDYRELLKGPLYYASSIALACAVYWRTSPIAIAAICNLCAGDGVADIVGRRFGSQKIPYNREKSIIGSLAMVTAGFLASVGYMYYFSMFGYIKESWGMILRFFTISLATAVVESHPLSSKLDDNLTVPLAAVLLGNVLFSNPSALIS